MTGFTTRIAALALVLATALSISPASAQETAGQLNGEVVGATGDGIAGAQVTVKHAPSGTTQTFTTNAQGRFIGRGLRLGGPYEVSVTAQGTTEQVRESVFLVLGEPFSLVHQMGRTAAVEEIVVTGVRVRELTSGPTNEFDRDRIVSAPSVSRDLKDVLRGDAKVYVDRFNSDAIQIAGSNNRFNLLTVDGIRQSDDFGLNNNGYPSLRSPVSIDIIDQLSVNTAPYAVTYSGFQGGNVNIVTKSGTNEFTGSIYGYYSDDSLLGNNSGDRPVIGFDFKDKTYGGTFGGPIVEDKLFFFAGYEHFKTGNPVTTGPAGGGFTNSVTQVSQADYDLIKSIAKSVYNYDILDLPKALPETDEKWFVKVNWNINDDHRLILSHNHDKGNAVITPNLITLAASPGSLGSGSNGYDNTQKIDAITAQLFSDWTDELKTELKFGYKKQSALPTPLGVRPFSEMQIRTSGGGLLAIGPDRSRHFNSLSNKLWNAKLKGDYLIGDHTVTAGVEREMLDVFNAFIQDSYGSYLFNSIADFQARRAATLVYQNAVTNVQADGAASFKYNVNSVYLQDSWDVNADLTVTAGVRYEWFTSSDAPRTNSNFVTRYGFANTETYDGRHLLLPRLAMNYTFDDATTLRAGIGLFGGGTPNVWLSNSFANDGVGASNTTITRTGSAAALVAQTLDNVVGTSVPAAAQALLRAGDGSVNALDPNFKNPSLWKASIGIDRELDLWWLGDDYLLKADLIYGKVNNAQTWIENRIVPTGARTPDGRPIYARRTGVPAAGNDLILTNTERGRSWIASIQLAKNWETEIGDITLEVGYTYQDVTDVNAGTSSTAQSNWDNLATENINDPTEATSNYELKHNAVMAAQWSKAFWGDYKTSVSLFGNARSGRPYSYTFAGTSAVFGDPRQAGRQRQLFYVPKDQNDVNLAGGLTWDVLNQYIIDNGLDKYRGQIVPRNAYRSPASATLDFRFMQEIPGLFEDSKGVFTFDIRNLTNMINSSWGRNIQINFPFVVPVVEATSIAGGKYTYSGPLRTKNRILEPKSSVWQIQFGARYEF